jgi:dTDP-glucose 4,6-dehydratase
VGNRSTLGEALKHPNFRFFKTAIRAIDWYLQNRSWWENILSGEYRDYYEKMYANR